MTPFEVSFPGLVGTVYLVTSPKDPIYNCIAWTAGEADRWWWPDARRESHWPDGTPRKETLEVFVAAFATLGFVVATDPSLVPDLEKIALLARDGIPTHMCRQLPNGKWTSKLGRAEDVEHELHALCGAEYGDIVLILERRGHSTR